MKYKNPEIESSYRQNDIGRTLYETVLQEKPKKIIEFGSLNGYSAVCMAMALDELGEGVIHSYDLWDQYPYKHGNTRAAYRNIKRYGVEKYVKFYKADFWNWKPDNFDLFHLDISNDGNVIKDAYHKLRFFGGRILFEGGTFERDNVEWMHKYNKPKIFTSGIDYWLLNENFPGLSMIK